MPSLVVKDYGFEAAEKQPGQMVAAPSKYHQIPYTALELDPGMPQLWTNLGAVYRMADQHGDAEASYLFALELDPRGEAAFQFLPGAEPEPMRRFREGTGLIVSEPFAYRRDLAVGDVVPIVGTEGVADVPIAGIFQDYGSEQGTVMMGRVLYDRLFADDGITSLGLFLDDGADSEAVVDALLRVVPADRSVIVRTNDTLRRASLDVKTS